MKNLIKIINDFENVFFLCFFIIYLYFKYILLNILEKIKNIFKLKLKLNLKLKIKK